MRDLSARVSRWIFVTLMTLGSAAISWGSWSYFVEGDMHPFVLEKLPLRFEEMWLHALHLHVVAAAWSLPACLLLVSPWFLRSLPRAHRWVGRITGLVVLFALVPSGAWLAFTAKGGLPTTIGFLLSGVIVVVAMVRGIRSARARDFVLHRRCTAHVVAQLSVAVTSRALIVGLDHAGVPEIPAYVFALWGPVVASAWIAEQLTQRRPHETRPAVAVPALLLDPVR